MKENEKMAVKKKCRAFFTAGMVAAGLSVVLPLQAKEAEEAAITPYTQETSVSDNDADPDPGQEDTAGKTAQADSTKQPQQPKENEAQETELSDMEKTKKTETVKLPVITSQPQDVRVEAGGYASFHVSAAGENLTYQWWVDTGDGSGFQEVAGANQELYRVMVFDGSMNGYAYKCRVKSGSNTDSEDGRENSGESGENGNTKKKQLYVDSRAATLSIYYRIVSGARSVWVKSSGRGLVFQGSGAYSKFSGISVDGSRITAGEYNKGGSQTPFTEITLLRSYLETLAEGEHELEIVWEDGAAKTSFQIEPPAANLPAEAAGLGRPDGDAAGSSRAAGTTAAAKDAGTGTTAAAGDAANLTGGRKKGETPCVTGDEKKEEEEPAQISENTLKSSSKTAADILKKTGVHADMQEEKLTVTPGERRTQSHVSDFEKSPVRLAAMSETVDQYAKAVCMAVILISAAGIASGFLVYRLHDVGGGKNGR